MAARLLPLGLVVLSLSLSAASAIARIGDNWDQCVARYGKPIQRKPGPDASTETGYFQIPGYLFTVRFFERRASLVSVTRMTADGNIAGDLTEAEITKHLRDNGGPRQWAPVEPPPSPANRAWKTADSSIHATYSDKTLVILTEAHAARARAAKAATQPQ